jgi:hypothetical protein
MTRRLSQTDVVVGERRRGPAGEVLRCESASSTHVGYRKLGPTFKTETIRRDVWTSWPVLEEAR